jgi:hypothetical protein
MTGFRGKVLLAGLLLLARTPSAPAWSGSGYGPAHYSYYAAVYYQPVYYPVYPMCVPMIPTVKPPVKPPAQKPKMPAATTKEPPLGAKTKKAPVITESRSQKGAYASGSSRERCKVGFWNLTGRDITLKVDGQERLLPRNRAITLTLARSFAWQIDQGETVTERVPDDQPFHEVLLRQ